MKEFEERVRLVEEEVINSNSEENRSKLHELNAEYIRFFKLEESILKQKTQLQYFKERDVNYKYFHALRRGRRRNLFIHKIYTDDDECIHEYENIATIACTHFQQIFTGQENRINEELIQCVPRMFSMNPTSAAGPDGYSG